MKTLASSYAVAAIVLAAATIVAYGGHNAAKVTAGMSTSGSPVSCCIDPPPCGEPGEPPCWPPIPPSQGSN